MSRFCGWVPNVIGRLSFSLAGLGSYPSRVVFRSSLKDGGQFFAGFQRRDLSDTTVPLITQIPRLKRFIDRQFLGKSGDFYFVCIMRKSKTNEMISGNVFVFDRNEWIQIRESFKRQLKYSENFKGKYSEFLDIFSKTLNSVPIFFQSIFTVKRDGYFITVPSNLPGSENFSNEEIDIEHAAAAQIYFFVRDLFHTHKFHSPNTDTILDVYRNDIKWTDAIAYALARKAIALRRQGTPISIHKSIGILSYLKSFEKNVARKTRYYQSKFSKKHFVNSSVAHEQIINIDSKNSLYNILLNAKAEFLRWMAMLSALFALFTSPSSIAEDSIFNGPIIRIASKLDGIFYSASLILIFLFIYICLKLLLERNFKKRDEFAGSIVTVSLPFKKNIVLGFLFSITILLIAIDSYIIYVILDRVGYF